MKRGGQRRGGGGGVEEEEEEEEDGERDMSVMPQVSRSKQYCITLDCLYNLSLTWRLGWGIVSSSLLVFVRVSISSLSMNWTHESILVAACVMSELCRCLCYKVGAPGEYWLFVSSCWTAEFWMTLTLNGCDMRTRLLRGLEMHKQKQQQCVCVHTQTVTLPSCIPLLFL